VNKTKKRKPPPGAKKKSAPKIDRNKTLFQLTRKLQVAWPEPRGLNVTETVIKLLDKVAITGLTKSEFDMTIGRLWFISRELLSVYFGDVWANKHDSQESAKPLGKFGKINDFEDYKHVDRLINIAETIYNAQKVEGIKDKIRLLKNEDVESILAELEGIQLILASSRKFKIINPSGIKGEDYEAEIYLEDGTPVACEMKCKFEETNFSEATLRRTITKAAEQLPKDRCGAVFIKLPELWKKTADLDNQILASVEEAFNHTKTVSVVVFHWETWEGLDSGGTVKHLSYGIETNPNARLTHKDLSKIILPLEKTYVRFSNLLKIPKILFNPKITENLLQSLDA
jgi:hypothetical protein